MGRYFRVHAIRRETRTDIRIIKIAGEARDRQVDAVDGRCNNGWMRALIEDPIRDVLISLITNSGPIRLSPEIQQRIAVWIALRAIVSEYDDYATRYAHHKQRKMLMEKQEISTRTWRIWIGRYEGMKAGTLWLEHPFLLLPDRVAARKKTRASTYTNSQTLTYVIGKLLIHVMRSPDEVALRLWDFPDRSGHKIRRIWPPTGYSISWPLEPLTDDEATVVGSAFFNYLISIAGVAIKGRDTGLYTKAGKPL